MTDMKLVEPKLFKTIGFVVISETGEKTVSTVFEATTYGY